MIGWYVFFLEKHPLTQTMFHAFSDLAKGRIQFQTKKHLKSLAKFEGNQNQILLLLTYVPSPFQSNGMPAYACQKFN